MSIDKSERELIESVEKGEWKSSPRGASLRKRLRTAAKATMLKDQRMNIRIAKRDLLALKTRAMEQGMPYQSLVSSILHKYLTGQLAERGNR
jgi:predicted DNA binding CopG/RHH family protein